MVKLLLVAKDRFLRAVATINDRQTGKCTCFGFRLASRLPEAALMDVIVHMETMTATMHSTATTISYLNFVVMCRVHVMNNAAVHPSRRMPCDVFPSIRLRDRGCFPVSDRFDDVRRAIRQGIATT